MEPVKQLCSPILVLDRADIDTDQIIPARFLTTTSRAGLGAHAFADWRADPSNVLDDPRAAECRVLVAGRNFGCGSSREHAVWALQGFGFRAVVSTSFAEIFAANAVKNGLVPVKIHHVLHARLVSSPWSRVEVDVEALTLRHEGGAAVPFPLDPFARRSLLAGEDELDYLLAHTQAVARHERSRS